MPKPDFFIVGAPKCGTTAMNSYLGAHPAIFVPADKDVRFFGSDLGFRDRLTPEQYAKRFDGASGYDRIGDASVWYLYSSVAAREIWSFNPESRIIIMLRRPVDMMYSLHSQSVFNGLGEEDIPDFEAALRAEPDRRAGRRIPPGSVLPEALFYRDAVRYHDQVARYFDVFGRGRVHVVLYDDFKANTAAAYRDVLRFLEVDDGFAPEFRVINANKVVRSEALRRLLRATPEPVKALLPSRVRMGVRNRLRSWNVRHRPRPPLDPELRRRLEAEMADEVSRLARLLGRDLSHWTAA